MTVELDRDDPLAFLDGGEVVMENPGHGWCRDVIANTLRYHFREREDVFVGNNVAIQYDPDDRTKVLSADVFVALHSPNGERPRVLRSWKTWEHGIPTVVIEVTSRSTVAQWRRFRPPDSGGTRRPIRSPVGSARCSSTTVRVAGP